MTGEKKYTPGRIALMLGGILLIGVCVAFIITKYAKEKISFRLARIASDVTAILVGMAFCLLARNRLWEIVGLGAVVNACCNGPLIQFFRGRLEKALLR